jgi:hypothetical protein
VLLPGQAVFLTGTRRFSTASPCTPLQQSTVRGDGNEASTKVHAIDPSGLPLACGTRVERDALGLSPGLRTPPTGAGRRTPEWGQAIEHGLELRAQHHIRVDPPIGSSLTTSDLASHDSCPLLLCQEEQRLN